MATPCCWRFARLRLLLAALALAAAHTCLGRSLQQRPGAAGDYDVVVVGAGMAGIAAARTLAEAGLRVLVLEGRDRAGGRLASIQVLGGFVDAGAMWIHEGQPGNALYDLALGMGLAVSPQQNYNSLTIYSAANGTRASPLSYARTYRQLQTKLVPEIQRMRSTPGTADASLAAVYAAFLDQSSFTPSEVGQANSMWVVFAVWRHGYAYRATHGACTPSGSCSLQALLNGNATQLSTLRLGDAKSIPAVDVMISEGFNAVADVLKQGLDIQYGAVVTGIERGAEAVTVTTADGGAYGAEYAIGYGLLDKVMLVFNTTFWDAGSDFILREMPDLSGRFAVFLNYNKLFPGINALVAIHVADTAAALEQQSDAEVVGEGMAVLRQLYGAAVPDPIQVTVTRWAADPFSRGSYSFFAVGNPKSITAELEAPVGRLLFAGEATSDKPATVLGAYLSGLREAKRVLGLLGVDGGYASPAAEASI
ncbi:hypothetical protein CHLNCDRAFT_50047 [Chlorella variabilis]|uniref:Amine oxidase domain-containing protein n=1 Tax=Chlorella variabilis TaxID=554065 RepID=E1Z597_CHLVA|nr:hypothetical protein CHLNCDRAFT_50047 [Chlorella variabilis]EFN59192.1 hypothetical protein CHLNCDRAFT_50047 [Chlorella variabilis]|eukprot:XP_005851294.1 hypothetical protein CHLNCDRAFT_50047 [Chlorella variabilis]